MKQLLVLLIVVLAFGLHAVVGSAQQKGKGGEIKIGPVYDPAVKYPGGYQADMLLFKNGPNDTIWRRIPILDQLSKVTCPGALEQLKRDGKWQGHLKPDGSCGSTAEPADWAMGNRLNYDEALEQDSR